MIMNKKQKQNKKQSLCTVVMPQITDDVPNLINDEPLALVTQSQLINT